MFRWFPLRHPIGTLLVATWAWAGSAGAQTLTLHTVASGFANPVGIVNAHDGSNRLFVVEQGGTIRIISGGVVLSTPFLDIGAKLISGGERGLLGLAFDPSYSTNGFFYVYYTSQPAGEITIARYSVSGDPNVANANSEHILKTQTHSKASNHNGGSLVFGPDGCLYAGIGDGGGGGDPDGNGQNLGTLLGKIIRISKTNGAPCPAAPGNPFVGMSGARGEIWALGVRNPWRITFDRQTGDLFVADVGQGLHEEVDFQPPGVAGRNYCWNHKEGKEIFNTQNTCTIGKPTDPVIEYDHVDSNCSITGGYRYRGSQFPAVVGTYIYGDYCTGRIWGATESLGKWTSKQLLHGKFLISTFGEDEAGEIYVARISDTNGIIYRLVFDTSLVMSPATNVSISGPAGGTFFPSTFQYSLSSAVGSVNYSVSMSFDSGAPQWLTVTPASGTVKESSTHVKFALNAAANSLAPGTYHATITFTNTTNGKGTQQRTVTLVVQSHVLKVTPSANIFSSGPQGGPFSPSSFVYKLTGAAGSVLYTISGIPDWLTASPTSGTATAAGVNVTFKVDDSALGLAPGTHQAIITFTNKTNGIGTQTRTARLAVTTSPLKLVVIPTADFNASGKEGGPFSPSAKDYSLRTTSGNVNFTITGVPAWLTPSVTSGTASTTPRTLRFTINSTANSLSAGKQTATIQFVNTTNGRGNQSRKATLTITAPALVVGEQP